MTALLCLSPPHTLSFLDLNSAAYSCLTSQWDIFLPAQSFQNHTTEANPVSFLGGGEEIGDKGNVLQNASLLSFSWTSSGFFSVELSSTLAKLQHAKDSHSELCFF